MSKVKKTRRIAKRKKTGSWHESIWLTNCRHEPVNCPKCKLAGLRTDLKRVWCSYNLCDFYTSYNSKKWGKNNAPKN